MAKRPTIADLAREADVSVATVDRVLNGRAKVRQDTAKRVYDAARAIGYHGVSLLEQRIFEELPELRVGFVFQKEKQAFYKAFHKAAEDAAARATGIRAKAIIRYTSGQTPGDFVEQMELLAPDVHALASTAVTHVDLGDAVHRFQAAGKPCFALLNDFAQGIRRSYIGLNNIQVGRIAAHMASTAARRSGKVAIFVGGYRWHGHELRETGFRSYFREYAPQFEILNTLVNLETRQLTYEATLDLLNRHPDLVAIYCAGGGMEGAIAALREVRKPREVSLIVNELTPESRRALADRYVELVIGTPLDQVCDDLFALARKVIEDSDDMPPAQHFLSPNLFLPESIA
ncbi:LacI family DNA-binding transcriptional regulator [Yoonia sp. SS1-5]|uniref:LacI family DNA-binding transcriptional regulator n=1 Tax=Yoonia rhodophyticola TaxID=3137370 RepID=A0AAN0MAD9_9RHOB